MYTTDALATQLLKYLKSLKANISKQDFNVVKEGQPFPLILSDGKRLDGLGFSQTPLISGSFINDVCAIAFSQLVISESNLNNFKMMTKAFPPI